MALVSDLVQIGINSRQAAFLGDEQVGGLALAGLAQGTATPITTNISRVTTGTGGVSEGAILPLVSAAKQTIYVVQNSSAITMKLYPGVGDFINGLAANTPRNIPSGSGAICVKFSGTGWLVMIGT